ncbi:glycosyltransferase family 2 protein [Celeribacter ethanolicus]|uniref:glycosyltransferase family 2 protein n=1 Tax=Celeribacter ethanolicus TaxID=1758178 RepID=UPI000831CB40|nr:glycosyltransferase family 2 protein [Celeribacter ethanolicus]
MKISIITAVYNREATIGQALQSVAEQSYDNVEHLIIDGASTDRTLDEVERFKTPNMRVISEPDDGIYHALNKGIDLASGDVVGLMHSDDFFAHTDVLKHVAQKFSSSWTDAVYGDLDYVSASDTNKVIRHWVAGQYASSKLRRGWMPPHPSLFLRSSVMKRWGGYDTSFRIAADYDSILRYFGRGNISAAYLPEVLVKMRVGGESNRSLERILRKSSEDYRALKKNEVGGVGALIWKNLSKLGQFVNKG